MQEVNEKPIILRRKVKIYVDISLKDDNEFQMGQRLISFFGQSSIFENTDVITDYLDDYFSFFSLSFLTFGEDNFFENDILDNDINLQLYKQKDTEENENFFNRNTFFLPVVVFFYYSDKRTDFFVLKTFKKKYQLNLHKWLFIVNFLKSKEKKTSFFKNTNYFNYVKNYFSNIKIFKDFHNNKFSNIINLTTTTFLKPEELFYQPWDSLMFYFKKRKTKFSFYKFYTVKKIKNFFILFKSLFSMPLLYVFNMDMTKTNYLDEEFDYKDFIDTLVRYIGQLYISKKMLFRRLRRRKRFKRKIMRNFNGIKTTYYKIYATVRNKKKKKGK